MKIDSTRAAVTALLELSDALREEENERMAIYSRSVRLIALELAALADAEPALNYWPDSLER